MYHEPEFETTRDEMMKILEQHIPFLNKMELVPLAEADGRVAAEDVLAPYSLLNWDASSCDGIEEIQPTGSQMQQGEILVCRGERIGPTVLSILLSAGMQSVAVYTKPCVLFLPSGDELVPAGGQIPAGKNVESNSLMISAMLRRFGCQPAVSDILPDNPQILESALKDAVQKADLVIISVGSSKGEKDFTMDVLEKIGTVVVQELGVAPGNHCSLTIVDNKPVLGIPGPPGGAQLICQYYVRAAVELLLTGQRREPVRVQARLTSDIPRRQIDFMQSIRLFWEDGVLCAEPVMPHGMTRAEGRQISSQILYCPKGRVFHAGYLVPVELPLLQEAF